MNFRFDDLGKEYTGKTLFREVNAACNPTDRIGLVGRNGSGKTTLLDIIEGALSPDTGHVHRSSRLSFSRVRQLYDFGKERSLLEEALTSFSSLKAMGSRLRELEALMAETGSADHDAVNREYEMLLHRFEFLGGYDYHSRAEKMLLGLGFSRESLGIPTGHLSGGQKNRLALVKALLEPADVLLLDEPTNHLDLRGILWLTRFLGSFNRSFVLISHDRNFLDSVTGKTWELESGRLYEYPAPYTRSREMRRLRLDQQEKQYQKQQDWKSRTEDYIRRNMAGQKTRQAQSRLKQLQKTDWIELDRKEEKRPVMKIPPAPRGGSLSFSLQDGEVGFPGVTLIKRASLDIYRGDRIGFLGGNGSGKSTLLRTVSGEIPLLSGSLEWGSNNISSYFAQEADFDSPDMTVMEWISSLNPSWDLFDVYSFAALFHFRREDTEKKISFLSGGERSRLRFARLFSSPANVMLLDEPTNHLDIESREALESSLQEYTGTLMVVSHDIYFMKQVADRFYVIKSGRLEEINNLDTLGEVLEEPGGNGKSGSGKKEWKSREGLSKNQIARLERKISDTEEMIEQLEAEKKKLGARVQQGVEDHRELARIGERFDEIESEMASILEEWESAHRQLEE